MSIEDPAVTLVKLLTNNILLTKDNGTTSASCHVSTAGYNSSAFKSFDAQVTVALDSSGSSVRRLGIGSSKVLFQDTYIITGWAVDKPGVTGKKMRWKLRQEIERVIRTNRTSPGGNIRYVDLISGIREEEGFDSKPVWWSVSVPVVTHRVRSDSV